MFFGEDGGEDAFGDVEFGGADLAAVDADAHDVEELLHFVGRGAEAIF